MTHETQEQKDRVLAYYTGEVGRELPSQKTKI